MLRAIVVALLLSCGAALSQEPSPGGGEPSQPQQSQAAPSQQPSAGNQQTTAPPPITVNVLPTPKTEEERAEEARERHEKTDLDRRLVDLTGELAFFTAGLFAATIALFIATAGLAFFGWQQARDMKASIAASAASAKAAEDAVAVARQAIEVTQAIGRAQVRAYIAASDFSIQIDRERKPVVKFRYSNAGQSPARSITIQMDVGIGPFPVNHARTFAEIDTAPIQPASTPVVFTQTSIIYPDDLPAQSSQERTVRVNSAFSETAMVTFRKEASGCIVKGTISFDDIFNERIVEAFEYMVFSHPGHDISNFTSMARQPQSFLRKR